MASFSDYLEDKINNWINGTAFAAQLTGGTFVQLYSQSPTDTGSATGALYTRINVASGGWTVGTPAGTITNTAAITITASAGSSATASHVGVFDASGSGNMLFHGALTASKTIEVGDEVKFNASTLTLTIA